MISWVVDTASRRDIPPTKMIVVERREEIVGKQRDESEEWKVNSKEIENIRKGS